MMKRLSVAIGAFLALAILLTPTLLRGAESAAANPAIEIVRVWTHYRDAASFVRLVEYFTGKENTGDTVVLRSQPEVRDGFYFTVRVAAKSGRLPDFTLRLQVIPPDGKDALVYSFRVPAENKRSVHLEAGLTGAAWPHGDVLPLAWKLEILAADARTLASQQSFLWDDPAATDTP